MASVQINIDGLASIQCPAERCVLKLSIHSEGPLQSQVSTEVASTSSHIHKLFKDLSPKESNPVILPYTAVTVFSMTRLHTSSKIVRDDSGQNPIPEHTASVAFEATFRDFDKLGEVMNELFGMKHVSIDGTTWSLTEQTRQAVGAEGRKSAIRDAISKAQDYADVLEKKVAVIEITDRGSSVRGRTKQTARKATTARAAVGTGMAGFVLEPEDVEFSIQVAAKFVAE